MAQKSHHPRFQKNSFCMNLWFWWSWKGSKSFFKHEPTAHVLDDTAVCAIFLCECHPKKSKSSRASRIIHWKFWGVPFNPNSVIDNGSWLLLQGCVTSAAFGPHPKIISLESVSQMDPELVFFFQGKAAKLNSRHNRKKLANVTGKRDHVSSNSHGFFQGNTSTRLLEVVACRAELTEATCEFLKKSWPLQSNSFDKKT